MAYVTVFDVAQAGYKSASFAAHGLLFVAIGVAWVVLRRRLLKWSPRSLAARKWFSFGFLGFALLWTLGSFGVTYGDYHKAARVREDGSARVVQGVVTEFVPMPFTGHSMERFCVTDVCFAYSDYVITAGFNQTASHGGPIRAGLPVRVTYLGNTILKLEVRTGGGAAS